MVRDILFSWSVIISMQINGSSPREQYIHIYAYAREMTNCFILGILVSLMSNRYERQYIFFFYLSFHFLDSIVLNFLATINTYLT